MYHKLARVIILTMVVIVTLTGCNKPATDTEKGKIKVVATIYPVYEFVRQVGGDKVDVTMLLPPGAEPHDWEPTAKDLVRIKATKLFFYNGAGLEPVTKLLHKDVLGSSKPIEVSQGIPLLKSPDKHTHGKDHKHDTDTKMNEEQDPHVWLDPEYAKIEVANIEAALINADPSNKEYYQQNSARYQKELSKLHEEYVTELANLSRRDIVTTHAAFQYLAKRYNLNQVPIMGLAPNAEPTPDKMKNVVLFCREHAVTTIFFETLVSPRVAKTIAGETGAKLLVLNPIAGLTEDDIKNNKNYLIIMRENLLNLKMALQ